MRLVLLGADNAVINIRRKLYLEKLHQSASNGSPLPLIVIGDIHIFMNK